MFAPIDEIIKEMKCGAGTVTDYTKDGKCVCCGECCGDFLPISDDEIRKIRKYVRSHGIKEYTNKLINTPINFKCPFRDDAKRICTIYEIRPEICRSFMCNYDRFKIEANKKLLHQRNSIISMRATFFGNQINQDYLSWLLGDIPRVIGGING